MERRKFEDEKLSLEAEHNAILEDVKREYDQFVSSHSEENDFIRRSRDKTAMIEAMRADFMRRSQEKTDLMQEIAREREQLLREKVNCEARLMCGICMNRDKNTSLVPCG